MSIVGAPAKMARKQEILAKNKVRDALDKTETFFWSIDDNRIYRKVDVFVESRTPGPMGTFKRPLWIEFKFIKSLPARYDTPIKVAWQSEMQRQCALERAQIHGNCWVAIMCKDRSRYRGVILRDPEELDKGITKDKYITRMLSIDEIAAEIEEFINETFPENREADGGECASS